MRVSVGVAFGRRFLLPALPTLTALHPQLSIDVDLHNRTVDLVAEAYDIGIRGGFIEDSSLSARRVRALPVALFAGPGYLRRAGMPASPEGPSGAPPRRHALPGRVAATVAIHQAWRAQVRVHAAAPRNHQRP